MPGPGPSTSRNIHFQGLFDREAAPCNVHGWEVACFVKHLESAEQTCVKYSRYL